jgi:hypothetical protein
VLVPPGADAAAPVLPGAVVAVPVPPPAARLGCGCSVAPAGVEATMPAAWAAEAAAASDAVAGAIGPVLATVSGICGRGGNGWEAAE